MLLKKYTALLMIFIYSYVFGQTGKHAETSGDKYICRISRTDAEKILGQHSRLSNSSVETKNKSREYKYTYTANETEAGTGKLGHLYYMFEQYNDEESAIKVYNEIFEQNSRSAGFGRLSNMGDQALIHTDHENFKLIILRKGNKIIRLKVNRLTRLTSSEAMLSVVGKIAGQM